MQFSSLLCDGSQRNDNTGLQPADRMAATALRTAVRQFAHCSAAAAERVTMAVKVADYATGLQAATVHATAQCAVSGLAAPAPAALQTQTVTALLPAAVAQRVQAAAALCTAVAVRQAVMRLHGSTVSLYAHHSGGGGRGGASVTTSTVGSAVTAHVTKQRPAAWQQAAQRMAAQLLADQRMAAQRLADQR